MSALKNILCCWSFATIPFSAQALLSTVLASFSDCKGAIEGSDSLLGASPLLMMAGDEGSRLVMRDSGPVIDLDLSTTMTGRMRNDGALLLPLVHFRFV
jgi:hypothetical protein